jgi:hypothetical protein
MTEDMIDTADLRGRLSAMDERIQQIQERL